MPREGEGGGCRAKKLRDYAVKQTLQITTCSPYVRDFAT